MNYQASKKTYTSVQLLPSKDILLEIWTWFQGIGNHKPMPLYSSHLLSISTEFHPYGWKDALLKLP
jgi:hypothetical protein